MADGICVILSDWWLCADKGCWYDRVVANNYFCQSITKGSWLEYTQECARAHYFWKCASWGNPDWNGLGVSLMQAAQSRPRCKVRQGCLALYPVQSWKTLMHGTCTTSLGHVLLPCPSSFSACFFPVSPQKRWTLLFWVELVSSSRAPEVDLLPRPISQDHKSAAVQEQLPFVFMLVRWSDLCMGCWTKLKLCASCFLLQACCCIWSSRKETSKLFSES